MKVTQAVLESGTTHLTCWIENRVKPGDSVTLKNSDDPRQWWTVVDTHAVTDVSSINRGWNNNI